MATRFIAVVGSGPSGFYAAEALLASLSDSFVDMYERLPTPYGLVRSGVAPDHPKLKQVTAVFDRIMRSCRFQFCGNVTIGDDVSLASLRDAYDIVVLAYGASDDRKMGIPGEHLANCHSATDFVGWYNGHPDYRDHEFDLSSEVAVVVGHGNVAADISRILLQPIDALRSTDIAAHALEALSQSKVREVHLIGRRGPAQAKFTTRELRGLGAIPDCFAQPHNAAVATGASCEQELAERSNLNALQNVQFFRELSGLIAASQSRRLHFHFLLSPERLVGSNHVESFILRRNELRGDPFSQQAVPVDEVETIECGLVFSSIGYRGKPLEGIPFDLERGIVPNRKGRVEAQAASLEGLYVTGWLKRGPTGIIGTNRADSIETVQQIVDDLPNLAPRSGERRSVLLGGLSHRSVQIVGLQDWLRIDDAERRNGLKAEKPREKFTRVAEMLAVASAINGGQGDSDDRHGRIG